MDSVLTPQRHHRMPAQEHGLVHAPQPRHQPGEVRQHLIRHQQAEGAPVAIGPGQLDLQPVPGIAGDTAPDQARLAQLGQLVVERGDAPAL